MKAILTTKAFSSRVFPHVGSVLAAILLTSAIGAQAQSVTSQDEISAAPTVLSVMDNQGRHDYAKADDLANFDAPVSMLGNSGFMAVAFSDGGVGPVVEASVTHDGEMGILRAGSPQVAAPEPADYVLMGVFGGIARLLRRNKRQ